MAGRIPEAFLQTLLSRTDIVDVVRERVPTLKKSGTNYSACCPFHDEKTPSFSVSQAKQFYHCFGCQVHGDVIQFIMEFDGIGFVQTIELLASRLGLSLPKESTEINVHSEQVHLYEVLELASKFYQEQWKVAKGKEEAIQYMRNRGLTGQIAKQFQIGFAPPGWEHLRHALESQQIKKADLLKAGLVIQKEGNPSSCYDRFRARIMFPIHDLRGRVVGFGGRVYRKEDKPKYLNSPETPAFNKSQTLYGLYEAKKTLKQLSRLIIVEGYMDVVTLAQYGIPEAVATLGTSLTEKHIQLLFKQTTDIIFCFDGDAAGFKAAERALHLVLPLLDKQQTIRFLFLPDNLDPDSYLRREGREAFLEQLERAIPLADFIFKSVAKDLDIEHIEGKNILAEKSGELIDKIPNFTLKAMLYHHLAGIVSLDPAVFLRNAQSSASVQSSWKPKPYSAKNFSSTQATLGTVSPASLAERGTLLVLKNRELLSLVGDLSDLKNVNLPGVNLFCAIIALLKEEPNQLLETLLGKLPANLASHFHEHVLKFSSRFIPSDGLEQEFKGVVKRLREGSREKQMENLLHKAQGGKLSQQEKAMLLKLLQEKDGVQRV